MSKTVKYGKGFKVGQKVIFQMLFKGLRVRRFCAGEITALWTDINWTPVKVFDSIQIPRYNAVTWNDQPNICYKDMAPYTKELWENIVSTVRELNSTSEALNNLITLNATLQEKMKILFPINNKSITELRRLKGILNSPDEYVTAGTFISHIEDTVERLKTALEEACKEVPT